MELWLLRHAKAQSDSVTGQDRDRALSASGQARCQQLHDWLELYIAEHPRPNTIVYSPAKRTLQTARLVTTGLAVPEPQPLNRLWAASTKDLVSVINDLADQPDPVWLIGHNPGLSDLVAWLARPLPWPGMEPGCLIRMNVDLPLHPGAGEIIEII